METVPNPPSFYDDDMNKWSKKFENHIKERALAKKLMSRTQTLSCLTKNTNIKSDDHDSNK